MLVSNEVHTINIVVIFCNGNLKGVGRKFFRGGGATEKRPKNSTFKPLFTIFVPCLKTQGGATPPLPPAADAHGQP